MKKSTLLVALLTASAFSFGQVRIETDLSQTGKNISTDLIGAFFEDINYAADGGLYAELVQNRSFEYYTVKNAKMEALTAWSLFRSEQSAATMKIEADKPLNDNNIHYLKVSMSKADGEVGVQNAGYNGIPLEAGKKYLFSVYLRGEGAFKKPIQVRLLAQDGSILAKVELKGVPTSWKKFSVELVPSKSCPKGRLELAAKGKGSLCLDMVSLFPAQTFKNRTNGLREDLAQAIADIQPRFLRFPGGCITHGAGNDNAYRWKNTVGDVAERKANWNLWGYHQTYGLGFYEYFQFCEDIGAKPLPVLPMGISCQFRDREIVPLDQMGPWVQDAVDLVEFANGAVTSKWGKVRADMGHPEPFGLQYICIGNEEDDIPAFRERFQLFESAMKQKCPEIKVLGTSGVAASGRYFDSLWEFSKNNKVYGVDEHYYMGPNWFLANNHRYDNYDRSGPKVFMGEYASQNDLLANAIAEAAFLTGAERNADIIQFACYAPLLCRENNNQWHPDLIRFDNTRIAKTASYYVQQMYGQNAGDKYLNSTVSYQPGFTESLANFSGKVGVGSWQTQAEFDDLKVVDGDGNILINENFQGGNLNWTVLDGLFEQKEGSYVESSQKEPAWSICNTVIPTGNYTLTVRAKKRAGAEGFVLPFAFVDEKNYSWLNIGGWGNSQHAVETCVNGSKSTLVTKGGRIENDRWYVIRIDVKGASVKCFLDNVLILDVPTPEGPVTTSVTKDSKHNEVVVKIVNSGSAEIQSDLVLKGLNANQEVTRTTLTGDPTWRNSVESPRTIVPTQSKLLVQPQFKTTLPPNSFQVFRVKLQ
jgi:alpha-L-arabinofuranosidase